MQSKVTENNELLKAHKHISFEDGTFSNKPIADKTFTKKLHTQFATNNLKSKPNIQMSTMSLDNRIHSNIYIDSNVANNRR